MVRGGFRLRIESGVGEGECVAEIDKSPVQPGKDRSGLVVRPGEATA